jgi:hypothetical protein
LRKQWWGFVVIQAIAEFMPMRPCRRASAMPPSQDPPHGHRDAGVRLKNLSGDEQRRAN